MKRLSWALATLFLATFADLGLAQVAPGQGELTVKLISTDFAPEDGNSYNPKWAGPPRKPWVETDQKFYALTAKLSAPAPEDFSVAFLVRENKTWDIDPVMASVIINFVKGDMSAQGRFWLVCNREGRIQGNLGQEYDGYGNLYAKANARVTDPVLDTWKFVISAPTVPHSVQCK